VSRTAEEWGRLAVSLPGWRWMPGMLVVDTSSNPAYRFTGRAWDDGGVVSDDGDGLNLECICAVEWPDPDDPATAGCLLALAGAPHRLLPTVEAWLSGAPVEGITSLGRAVIVDVRDQWGRWPGGEA
jgi:hypothetical protein